MALKCKPSAQLHCMLQLPAQMMQALTNGMGKVCKGLFEGLEILCCYHQLGLLIMLSLALNTNIIM